MTLDMWHDAAQCVLTAREAVRCGQVSGVCCMAARAEYTAEYSKHLCDQATLKPLPIIKLAGGSIQEACLDRLLLLYWILMHVHAKPMHRKP